MLGALCTALALGACGDSKTAALPTASASGPLSTRVLPGLPDYHDLLLSGGDLYAVNGEVTTTMHRLSTTGRHELAARTLPGLFGAQLMARGELWVLTLSNELLLWRLDPRSLRPRGPVIRIPERSGFRTSDVGWMALAGGYLWVGSDEPVRVSLDTGRAEVLHSLRHPGPVSLVANPAGTVLLALTGLRTAYLSRLDPSTGYDERDVSLGPATLEFGTRDLPAVAGIIGGDVWLNFEGSVTTAAVQRFSARTLRPAAPSRAASGPGSAVSVSGERLWLYIFGAHGRYETDCADPASGRPLARLPGDPVSHLDAFLPFPGDGSPSFTSDRAVVAGIATQNGSHEVLYSAAISAACDR